MTGFLVITFPFDTRPQTHTGNSGGQMHGFSFLLNADLTILSSSEWKVMMQSLHLSFRSPIIMSILSLNMFSSSFVSILIA